MTNATDYEAAALQAANPWHRDQAWPVYRHYVVVDANDGNEYVMAPLMLPGSFAESLDRRKGGRIAPRLDGEYRESWDAAMSSEDPVTSEAVVSNEDPSMILEGVHTHKDFRKLLFHRMRGFADEYWGLYPGEDVKPLPPYKRRQQGHSLVKRLIRRQLGAALRKARWYAHDRPLLPFRPLQHAGLILDFAEEYEDTGFDTDAVWRWVRTNGVLGLAGYDAKTGWLPLTRGGEGESVRRFREVAEEAWVTVRLYEAATAEGGPDVRKIKELLGRTSGTARALRSEALQRVKETVGEWVRIHTRIVLYHDRKDEAKCAQGYGFCSLVGAMYLQFMWIMSAQTEVRRCKAYDCSKLFVVGQKPDGDAPDPGQEKYAQPTGFRRTRPDKEFCTSNCAARHRDFCDRRSLVDPRRIRQT